MNIPYLGTIVNFFAIFICGMLGTLMKKGVPIRVKDGVMFGMGICIVYVGLDGALAAPPAFELQFVPDGSDGLVKLVIMIVSIAIGTAIGEAIDISNWVEKLGNCIEKRFSKGAEGSFSRGFVAGSILFCVGAMAVNGSFADAAGKPDILIAKSVIDGITVLVMATSLGAGCAFSAFPVLIYQGLLTTLGFFVESFFSPATIYCMSVTGSLVIVLIGTNLLGCTKVRTANMIPAIFLPLVFVPLVELLV